MRDVKYSTDMELAVHLEPRSSGTPRGRLDDGGFIMVVLLISMAVAAVWMTAALPSWRQQITREREAELIFRGESYARAIYLYRQKNNQTLPPNVDVLVSQRYLRKKYKDPITGKDFLPVAGVGLQPGGVGVSARGAGNPQIPGTNSLAGAGLIGVRSTSNEQSIRIYNNQQTYSQWAFDFTLEQLRAGGGAVVGPQRGGGARGELPPIVPGTGSGLGGGRQAAPGGGFPRGQQGSGRTIGPPTMPGPGSGAPPQGR